MTTIQKYLWVAFISMLPVIELRGAIPVGVGLNLPILPLYMTAVVANIIPVPFILLFAPPVLHWCTKLPVVGGLFNWIEEKGRKAQDKLTEKAGRSQYLALCLFVAIPLPGTGAWTGSLAAAFLKMNFFKALCAVAIGVVCAGIIMGFTSLGIASIF